MLVCFLSLKSERVVVVAMHAGTQMYIRRLDALRRSQQRRHRGNHLGTELLCSAVNEEDDDLLTKTLVTRSILDGFTNRLIYYKPYSRGYDSG